MENNSTNRTKPPEAPAMIAIVVLSHWLSGETVSAVPFINPGSSVVPLYVTTVLLRIGTLVALCDVLDELSVVNTCSAVEVVLADVTLEEPAVTGALVVVCTSPVKSLVPSPVAEFVASEDGEYTPVVVVVVCVTSAVGTVAESLAAVEVKSNAGVVVSLCVNFPLESVVDSAVVEDKGITKVVVSLCVTFTLEAVVDSVIAEEDKGAAEDTSVDSLAELRCASLTVVEAGVVELVVLKDVAVAISILLI